MDSSKTTVLSNNTSFRHVSYHSLKYPHHYNFIHSSITVTNLLELYFRSNGENLIAVADDFGKVRLFHYPAIYPKANSDPYQGHSSHVTNVTFTADDAYLISTGGNDAAILQWNVSEKEE